MYMPEGDPHPSTLPGFRGTRDPEHSVTRSRSGRKKKWVEFEDVQPQSIPNPTQENFPRRYITQLPDRVSHIYYMGKELTNRDSMRVHGTFTTVFKVWKDIAIIPALRNVVFQTANDTLPLRYLAVVNDLDSAAQYDWGSTILASLYHGLDNAVTTGGAITGFVQLLLYWFYEYCEVSHPIVKEEVGFVDCEQFVVGEERKTYALYWVEQISEVGHMLTDSQRMGNLDLFGSSALRAGITPVVVIQRRFIACPRTSVCLVRQRGQTWGESTWDAQRFQEVEDELAIARKQIDSIDHQLYSH
ncbi:hypothetical protein GIB67_000431, partial [Kingdonia uniflora]